MNAIIMLTSRYFLITLSMSLLIAFCKFCRNKSNDFVGLVILYALLYVGNEDLVPFLPNCVAAKFIRLICLILKVFFCNRIFELMRRLYGLYTHVRISLTHPTIISLSSACPGAIGGIIVPLLFKYISRNLLLFATNTKDSNLNV